MITEISRKRQNSTYRALVAKTNEGEVKTLGFKSDEEKESVTSTLSSWLQSKGSLKRGRGRPRLLPSTIPPVKKALTLSSSVSSLFNKVNRDMAISSILGEIQEIVKEAEAISRASNRDKIISQFLRSQ